jgi:hypothetical protein
MRATIACAVCGGVIGPHFQVLDHASCHAPSAAAAQSSAAVPPDAPGLIEQILSVPGRVREALTATVHAPEGEAAAPDTTPADRVD